MKPYMMPLTVLGLCGLFLSGCGNTTTTQDTPPTQTQTVKTPPQISPQSKEWADKGLAAYQEYNYQEAIANYNKAIEIDPNNYNALSGEGVALAMRGNANGKKADVAAGIDLIKKALELAPDDVASFYNLALAYKINGQYDESIEWFQKVIAKDPNNTWSYYGIATIYGDQGDAAHAVEYLQKAAKLDKANVLDAARTQSHFDKVRSDAAFQALVNS